MMKNKNSCIKFKNDLFKIFTGAIEYGLTNYLIGMAEGFDMIGAEVLIELRKKHKHIKIVAVVPCRNQQVRWSENQQKRYEKILSKCDEVIVLAERYTATCMNDRNRFMVEQSSVAIACFNGKPSGTAKTIRFAKVSGCKVKIINPEEYRNLD